jgi:putative Mn2+ efflux pump MntP
MNKHDTDRVSLAFGLVLAAIAGWWLLARLVSLQASLAGWVAAVVLLVLGALGVLSTLNPRRGRQAVDPEQDDAISRS